LLLSSSFNNGEGDDLTYHRFKVKYV
jgi:hypothetical protein